VSDAPIKTLILLCDGAERGLVDDAFTHNDAIKVTGTVEEFDTSWRLPPPALVDVVVVACDDSSEQGPDLVAEITERRPQLPIVVCRFESGGVNGFMQRAFAAGADDIVSLPEAPDRLSETLRKAIARKRGPAGADLGLSPLIAIVGPKGGTGKTVTACNLTAALADSGRRTVVVDLDLSFGDVALGLQLLPERTIHELVRMGTSLDAEKIEGFLTTHQPSGARALLAPIRPDHAGSIGSDFLARVFSILRASYDYVVVDTPAGFTTEVISAVDNSTDVCLVGTLDAFSLKDTKLGLETLELMGYDLSRVRIVLNRADTHVGITKADVTAILGRAPDILVPSDREVTRSINEGTPIVLSERRSGPARAFRELAELYLPVSETIDNRDNGRPPERRRSRVLGRR
jgi:pilus assembly protein CpaE